LSSNDRLLSNSFVLKWARQKYTQKLHTWKKIGAPEIYCMVLHGTIHKSYLKNKVGAPKIYHSKVQYYDTLCVHELKSTIPLHWVLRAYQSTYLPTDLPTYHQWEKKLVSDGRTVPYGTNHKRYMPDKKSSRQKPTLRYRTAQSAKVTWKK